MDSNISKIILVLAIILVVGYFFYKSGNKSAQADENLKSGQAFLAENKGKPDVVETASGLQYQVIKKGNGEASPAQTDSVLVHYHGTLIDGTVFDSSVKRGEPISFPLNRVISGWTEGLQLMSVGDTYKFFIPPQLAYGDRPAGKIGPQSTLIFEVELLAINP
ncbi:MAG: FKBP-type peptidyl-prolyl cis-trans isomerase [Pseudomonadota bacterium]